MKKVIIIFSILLLTACGNKKTLDIKKTTDFLNEKMQVETVEKSFVESKYGIDLSETETFVMATAKEFDKADMYLIALPKKGNQEKIKEQLNTLIEKYKNQWSMGYFEEEEHKVQNIAKKEHGDYIIYIVSDNSNQLLEEIK